MYPLSSIKQIEFLVSRSVFTHRKGNVCFWSLKVLLSGIQVLIDGFNVFVFQNPLINLFAVRKRKKKWGWNGNLIFPVCPFFRVGGIFSSPINQIFVSVYSLLSSGKKTKRVQICRTDFFCWLQKFSFRGWEEKIKEINICHLLQFKECLEGKRNKYMMNLQQFVEQEMKNFHRLLF